MGDPLVYLFMLQCSPEVKVNGHNEGNTLSESVKIYYLFNYSIKVMNCFNIL